MKIRTRKDEDGNIWIGGHCVVDADEWEKMVDGVEVRDRREGRNDPIGYVEETYSEGDAFYATVRITSKGSATGGNEDAE